MKTIFITLFLLLPLTAQSLYWKQVDSEYKRPIALKDIGNGFFLVVEKSGLISLTNFKDQKGVILNWENKITDSSNEQGFLGIALAPDFTKSGRAYFNLTNKKGNTEIWRYTFNPSKLSDALKKPELLLSFKQPHKNHNGGWLDFGPDGMLYIATGDGGSGNDPKNYAQNLNSYLGKVLRIDVSGTSGYTVPKDNPFIGKGKPEVFSYGLRNPWRCSWHESSLIIADVGQTAWEEVNYTSLKNLKGANFGWRLREGKVQTPRKKVGGNKPAGAIEPSLVYSHDVSHSLAGISITGGVVYDGPIKSLKGKYIFADYVLPRVWAAELTSTSYSDLITFGDDVRPDKGTVNNITHFTMANDGELYIVCNNGSIFKIAEK